MNGIGTPPAQALSVEQVPRPRGPGIYRNAYLYFSLALLVAIAGFFPSYFARLRDTDAIHHFHGILASAWMVGLVTQSWLMRQGMVSAHRAIGRASLLVAPLFVVSGILVVHVMLASDDGFDRAYGTRLAFVDLTTMAYFAVAYALALYHRRRTQLHARFMASTAMLVLPPALARLLGNVVPGFDSFESDFNGSYFICEAIVALLLIDDFRRGRALAPYAALGAILVLQQSSFLLSPSPAWWTAVASWIWKP